MFRIVSERTAWWPVTFAGVTEEGEVIDNRIELRFVILDEDAFAEFQRELAEATQAAIDAGEAAGSALIAPLMTRVVRDWRGVGAENGEPLPWSADNFRELLKVPNAAPAVGTAYRACRAAEPEQRTGN